MKYLFYEEHLKKLYPAEENIPQEFRHTNIIKQNEYLINGEMLLWNGRKRKVFSPILIKENNKLKKKLLGYYPLLTKKEAMTALHSAVKAYDNGKGLWPSLDVNERIRYIEKFLFLVKQKKQEIAIVMMWEIGKSFQESLKEFERTIDYIQNTIYALKELEQASSRFVIEQGIIGQIRRAPLGVVLCTGPYNYPLNETFTTLIPALLMGNTVIFKPPKIGVLLHYPILRLFHEIFPPGVINTLYGEGKEILLPLMESGLVDVLAFIGSSKTAEILKARHPKPLRLRSVLGLEAKNPAIVLPDADIKLAIKKCLNGSLTFNGQRCTALKILFVHKKIVKLFQKKFNDGLRMLKIGMPWEKDVVITPLPVPNKAEYLSELLKDSIAKGAKIINNSGGIFYKTLFYPAVLYPVNERMRIYHEEQFGPVVPIVPFDNIDEPIKYIIESSYGQQASIFGNDPKTIGKLVDILVNQVCRININSKCQRGPDIFPFAGRKDSGEGTLSVSDALRVFSMRTIVATKESEINRQIFNKIVEKKNSAEK